MHIDDGTGQGYKAKVTSDNRLRTHSVLESEVAYESEGNGNAYIWTASKDIDTTDNIIWLRNDSVTSNLHIQCITVSSDASGSWFIYCPTGTTADGDTITGVNLLRSSSNVAEATCRSDATGATPANYIYYGHGVADTDVPVDFHGALILGYLDEVAVDITDEPGLAQATVCGFFREAS